MSVTTVVAFGVEVGARTPASVEDVDSTTLVYDAEQQLMMVRSSDNTETLVPWCRHTDGPTTTNANTDGRGGPEYDQDHRED